VHKEQKIKPDGVNHRLQSIHL